MVKNKGITLIALVITIVILIILAGVSINLVLGENGLIEKAKQALKMQEEANFDDNVNLLSLEYKTSLTLNENGTNKLIEELEKLGYDVENLNNEYIVVYNEKTNSKKVIMLETGETINYKEYTEADLVDVIDISIWDGTSSDGLIGEGTALYPYLICSAKDFSYFRDQVNSKQAIRGLNIDKTENGKNVGASTACYKLMTDLYLNDISNFESWTQTTEGLNNWNPIGNYRYTGSPSFNGEFNGNNKIINGIYITIDESSIYQQASLFGAVGEIKLYNLGVEYEYIYSTKQRNNTQEHIGATGGLVGWEDISEIKNCYCKNAKIYGSANTGGLIGVEGTRGSKVAKVTESYFDGTINLLDNSYEIGVGGIIGKIISYSLSYTQKCYAKGTITINSDAGAEVGGICGFACQETQIENCYNEMNILVESMGTTYAGGICGKSEQRGSGLCVNMLNCYNLGTIQGATYLNGILAYNGSINRGIVRIENCYSAVNKNSENIDNEKILDWIKVDTDARLIVANSYTVINNKIYKYEYNIGAGESIQEVETGGVIEEYFYSREFIKDVLGWDLNIWNVTGTSHPTLK